MYGLYIKGLVRHFIISLMPTDRCDQPFLCLYGKHKAVANSQLAEIS